MYGLYCFTVQFAKYRASMTEEGRVHGFQAVSSARDQGFTYLGAGMRFGITVPMIVVLRSSRICTCPNGIQKGAYQLSYVGI